MEAGVKTQRRVAAFLLTLVLGACGPDAPAAPEGPVAWVGTWELGQERLTDLLVLAQPLPLDSATVGALVEQWISMAALAQRAGSGTDLEGPEAMEASLWLERREAVLDAERRRRLGSTATVTPQRARTEFQADTLRLLAHVLRRTGSFTSTAERNLQRRTAQRILEAVVQGGSWADAVAQSEDAESRDASGLLGLLRVAELPEALQGAAAQLQPGQISSVVESPEGYHVLYRPRFDDVADLYVQLLSQRLVNEAEGRATRTLLDSLQVQVDSGAFPALRALARGEPTTAGASPLARWTGGTLEADVAARYVTALPQDGRARLAGADDDALTAFLEQLAVRQVRLAQAEAQGVRPDDATLTGLEAMHRADTEAWTAALSEGDTPFSPQALDRYMERLVARQIPFEPVPPLFRAWLLESQVWGRDPRAQDATAAAARKLLDAVERGGVR